MHRLSLQNALLLLGIATSFQSQLALAGTTVETGGKDKIVTPQSQPERKGGLYVAIFGGVNVAQSSDEKHINISDGRPQPTGTPQQIAAYRAMPNDIPPDAVLIPDGTPLHSPTFDSSVGSDTGWMAGIKLGYEFPTASRIKPALEFEAFYNGIQGDGNFESEKALDGIRTSDRDGDESKEPFTNPDATVPRTKLYADARDQMNSAVFMWNGIIKMEFGRFHPYIGGGLGLAYVTHDYSINAPKGAAVPNDAAALLNTKFVGVSKYDGGAVARLPLNHSTDQIENSNAGYVHFSNDSEVTFAYQALAGIEYQITPRLSGFTEYKALFYYDGPYYRNLLNHEVSLGVKFGL
jgi:opacity protein-like surface antigen